MDLKVLRNLLKRQRLLEQDIWNVAKATFKPGVKIQFESNGREYFGKVIELVGMPGSARVRVENLATAKKRDVELWDITGLVQE